MKGIDYPNLAHVDEMVFLLTLNELVKRNREVRSLWVVGATSLVEEINLEVVAVGATSLVEEINLEVEGLFLLRAGRSPISRTASSCLAGKLPSAWATNPMCLQGPTSVSSPGSQSVL